MTTVPDEQVVQVNGATQAVCGQKNMAMIGGLLFAALD
jgi:hypothetical protein